MPVSPNHNPVPGTPPLLTVAVIITYTGIRIISTVVTVIFTVTIQ